MTTKVMNLPDSVSGNIPDDNPDFPLALIADVQVIKVITTGSFAIDALTRDIRALNFREADF